MPPALPPFGKVALIGAPRTSPNPAALIFFSGEYTAGVSCVVLCLTSCGGCTVSSFGSKVFGVGGRVLLINDAMGEEEGDFVGLLFSGVGLRGDRGGGGTDVVDGVEGTLVWIFNGEGGGAGRVAAARKGFAVLLA
jgi:hypothetical protein